MKQFSLLLSFLLLVSLLGGCSTTHPLFIEKDNLIKTMQLKKVSKLEQMQLTYRFANSLMKDERESFFNYLQLKDTQKEFNTLFSGAGAASLDVAKTSLKYSSAWEDALKSGNIGNQIGTSMIIGMSAAVLSNYLTKLDKETFTYYINDKNTEHLSLKEITIKYRKKTYQAIYDFAQQYDYEVICDFACKDTNHADDTGQSQLYLHDISTSPKLYYRPEYIGIYTELNPLIQKNNMTDNKLLNQSYQYKSKPYRGWLVRAGCFFNKARMAYTFPNTTNKIRPTPLYLFEGTYLHKKFYDLMTKNLKGFSYFYKIHKTHLAFYNGKTYQLNEELTDNSIIKGEWKPPMLPTLTPAQLNPAPTSP